MPANDSRFVDFKAVKAAVTMEQVLTHYGLLDSFKRSKDSLSGPCPIHQGTNPTQFRVSLSKNCWNCFSDCKCGGNVLDFVAKRENIEPLEAAHRLIEWFKLDLPEEKPEPTFQARETRYGKQVGKGAVERLSESVQVRSPTPVKAGVPATKAQAPGPNKPLGFALDLDASHPYLAERGLKPDTVEEFGLGFCSKGVMAERIAFPIHNLKGELVGYAGRWPGNPPDGRPKYRLPDGFKKSVEVFRLHHALQEPPDWPLIIVEGFFDVMRLWQLGLRKCVALMGSSLSDSQETLLLSQLRSDSQVIVMFDEDEAGRIGREEVLRRLARRVFVRVVAFSQEGFQPENLTLDNLKELGLPC